MAIGTGVGVAQSVARARAHGAWQLDGSPSMELTSRRFGARFNPRSFEYYERLGRVRAHLLANIDRHLTLAEAASVAGLNPKYFSGFFHGKVGVRFNEWVRFVRIQRARELLETTNRSITDVAFAVGFNDLRTFERSFKRETSETPWSYKRRVRPTGKRRDS